MRTKRKPKGGIAAANKPNNPLIANPAAANDTAVAIGSAAKPSSLGHSTPANASANTTMEPDPPAAVAMLSATANDANVPSRGEMGTTFGGGDSVDHGNLTILSCRCRCHQQPQRRHHCLSTCWTAKLAPATQRLMGKSPGSSSTPPILPAVWKQTQMAQPLILYPLTL